MKKYSLIASTILLVVLFIKLLSNYSERFDEVQKITHQSQNLQSI